MTKKEEQVSATQGLSKLGGPTSYQYADPSADILEAFPNRYPHNDYVIRFEHPEFTSVCPKTGQPDFGTIIVQYVPDQKCVESKSFKLYMTAYRNCGSFMESLTNKILEDLVSTLSPRRLTVEGIFNIRGGTRIQVSAHYIDKNLAEEQKNNLFRLW